MRAVTVEPTAAATSFAWKGSMDGVWYKRKMSRQETTTVLRETGRAAAGEFGLALGGRWQAFASDASEKSEISESRPTAAVGTLPAGCVTR